MNWFKRLSACMLFPVLASCAHMETMEMQDHPLAGKVWDVAAQRFVEPETVLERAEQARFVLLGEIHDNAEHHRIQARVLEALVKRGKRPALVMEQFDVDQQEKLNALARGQSPLGDKLRGLKALMRPSWDWPQYKPLVSLALKEKLPLIAGNLSRETLRTVAREGYQVLGSGEEERLALAKTWTDLRQNQLVHEVTLGHCGKIPDQVIQSVAKSQRARDAVMADKLLMAQRSGAVAIFGRNHIRYDMGVPLYLAARAPDASVLSVGLVEVDQATDPSRYAASQLGPLHDYLWFTARPVRKTSPCDSIPAQPKA